MYRGGQERGSTVGFYSCLENMVAFLAVVLGYGKYLIGNTIF